MCINCIGLHYEHNLRTFIFCRKCRHNIMLIRHMRQPLLTRFRQRWRIWVSGQSSLIIDSECAVLASELRGSCGASLAPGRPAVLAVLLSASIVAATIRRRLHPTAFSLFLSRFIPGYRVSVADIPANDSFDGRVTRTRDMSGGLGVSRPPPLTHLIVRHRFSARSAHPWKHPSFAPLSSLQARLASQE